MELIYIVVFGSCLILQICAFGKSGKADVKGNVLFQPKRQVMKLPGILFQSIAEFTKDDTKDLTQHEIKLVQDKKLLLKCVEDHNEAKVYILFSPEDHLVDRLKLLRTKDFCKSVNENIAVVEQPKQTEGDGNDKLTFTVSYKVNRENDQCLNRPYTLSTFLYYAEWKRGPLELTDCKGKTLQAFAAYQYADYFLSSGSFQIMDFNKYMDSVGEPSIHSFNGVPNLKLRCQTYTKKSKSGPIEDSTEAIGYIIYEDERDVIIEKLRLDSCDAGVNGMYINTKDITYRPTREFALVFKTTDGKCYMSYHDYYKYYAEREDKVEVYRYAPDRVNCPNDWTNEAALDVKPPLYIRFLRFNSLARYEGSGESILW